MSYPPRIDRERAGAAALTALAVAGLGYALVTGLTVSLPLHPAAAVMQLFAVAPPHPPPPPAPPPPPHPQRAAREGASAPPNLKSRATEVVAPKPVVLPLQPPPVVAAPVASTGADASSGAALVAGPGTGAGGLGNGTGSGRSGDGEGSGGTQPVQLTTIRIRDLPADARAELSRSPADFVVTIRFTVGVAGRLTDCVVTRSSGSPVVDAGTCQAALAKLRFRPRRDASGRPVPVTFEGDHTWFTRSEPPPDAADER